jgi:hypothetical protein
MAEEQVNEVLRLPTSTGEADVGPILEYRPEELWVTYDSEESNGGTVWTTLLFRDAIAIRLTPDQGCAPILIQAYGIVFEFESSDWKRAIQETNPRLEMPVSTRHFFLYFGDRGCLEVLAAEVSLDRPRESILKAIASNR